MLFPAPDVLSQKMAGLTNQQIADEVNSVIESAKIVFAQRGTSVSAVLQEIADAKAQAEAEVEESTAAAIAEETAANEAAKQASSESTGDDENQDGIVLGDQLTPEEIAALEAAKVANVPETPEAKAKAKAEAKAAKEAAKKAAENAQ